MIDTNCQPIVFAWNIKSYCIVWAVSGTFGACWYCRPLPTLATYWSLFWYWTLIANQLPFLKSQILLYCLGSQWYFWCLLILSIDTISPSMSYMFCQVYVGTCLDYNCSVPKDQSYIVMQAEFPTILWAAAIYETFSIPLIEYICTIHLWNLPNFISYTYQAGIENIGLQYYADPNSCNHKVILIMNWWLEKELKVHIGISIIHVHIVIPFLEWWFVWCLNYIQ